MPHRLARAAISFIMGFVSSVACAVNEPARVFISGHSLTDIPLPPYVASIAESLGQKVQWNRQYMEGSSILFRSRGYRQESGWSGYSDGLNREGKGLNVIEEFRRPRTTDGKPYDTLIITEQHGVLDSIIFNDSVRYLRHYHERFIEGNARGQTWFYEPWLGVIDKNDPSRWIAYEKAAAPMWQCIVSRINTSLAAEGRSDRIKPLPASIALVTLVERAARGEVQGLSPNGPKRLLDRLFVDQVHLTPLGAYYMALSVYATTFGRSPAGAWAPPDIEPRLAAALQKTAWDAVSHELATRKPLTLGQCLPYMKAFESTYFAHMKDDYWAHQEDSIRMDYRRLRRRLQWHWSLRFDFGGDPFRYDAATDKTYWFAPP